MLIFFLIIHPLCNKQIRMRFSGDEAVGARRFGHVETVGVRQRRGLEQPPGDPVGEGRFPRAFGPGDDPAMAQGALAHGGAQAPFQRLPADLAGPRPGQDQVFVHEVFLGGLDRLWK